MSFGGTKPPSVMPVPPPAPVNPGLNAIFSQAMGAGGAGAGTIDFLKSTMMGKAGTPGSATDVTQLFDAIKKASASTQQQGFGQIQNAFAASGAGMSSDMMAALSKYNVDYGSQLNQTLADLEFKSTTAAKGFQMNAASILNEDFVNAALAYAPTGQVVGGAEKGNLGGSLVSAGAEMGNTLITLAALGFL